MFHEALIKIRKRVSERNKIVTQRRKEKFTQWNKEQPSTRWIPPGKSTPWRGKEKPWRLGAFETGKAVWDLPAELVRMVDGSLFGVRVTLKKLDPLSGIESWSNNAGWSGILPYGRFATNNSQQLITFNGSVNITDRTSGDYVRVFQANQTTLDNGSVKGIFWDRNNSYFFKHGTSTDGTYTVMSLDAPWVE